MFPTSPCFSGCGICSFCLSKKTGLCPNQFNPELLPPFNENFSENRIKEGSIKAYFSSQVDSIESNVVNIKTPNGLVTIDNDYVLAMTGYKPNYSFLKSLGIEFDITSVKRPIYNEETLECNVPNMYIAGVIAAGLNTSELFIENTRDHGAKIISSILSKKEITRML